jgi:hypothetical protein
MTTLSGFIGLSYSGATGATGFTGATGAASTVAGATGPVQTNIPVSTNTTIVSSDAGKHIDATTGVTINSSTGFAIGDAVTIFNDTAGNITITATSITLYNAGTALTGNRTLAQRGLATVLCVGSNVYVIGGAGIS